MDYFRCGERAPAAGILPSEAWKWINEQGFSWQVRRGPPAGLPEWGAPLPRKLEAPLRTQDLRCLAPATVSTRLGGVLETSLRWPPICAAISRPLHPPRGYLQSSFGLICRWPGHLSLARFGPQQRTETLDSIARQVLTPLPAAYSSARFCAYPALRFPRLPTALRNIAPMLPVVGCGTRSAYRRTHFLHRRRSGSLSLSQVWRTNEGHRTAHRCRNPTSFSTTDQRCGMRLLSPTRKLWVLPGAAHLCASPSNRSLLPASSTTVFTILFRRSQFPRIRCHVSCPAAPSRHGLTPLLPTIEFA